MSDDRWYPGCENHRTDTLWQLYGLSEPGGPVRYVGITRGPLRARYRAHFHGGSKIKRRWFADMRARGVAPVMHLFGSLRGNLRTAIDVEVTLTRALIARGAPLMNREARFVG